MHQSVFLCTVLAFSVIKSLYFSVSPFSPLLCLLRTRLQLCIKGLNISFKISQRVQGIYDEIFAVNQMTGSILCAVWLTHPQLIFQAK